MLRWRPRAMGLRRRLVRLAASVAVKWCLFCQISYRIAHNILAQLTFVAVAVFCFVESGPNWVARSCLCVLTLYIVNIHLTWVRHQVVASSLTQKWQNATHHCTPLYYYFSCSRHHKTITHFTRSKSFPGLHMANQVHTSCQQVLEVFFLYQLTSLTPPGSIMSS